MKHGSPIIADILVFLFISAFIVKVTTKKKVCNEQSIEPDVVVTDPVSKDKMWSYTDRHGKVHVEIVKAARKTK